ncbi:hypothetical protein [Owenweeksia hongkongensis]|uniref:hypothetical protein n=1 Tax=Owenweeksia hongkongensis TaxID=253245 RepID=UPI003A8EC2DA
MKNSTFLTIAFCLFTLGLFAQPGNPSAPAPFGAIELLIAGGAALGGRYYYKNQKQKEE